MWKSLTKIASFLTPQNFLFVDNVLQQAIRTTFILKRRNPPLLHKKGGAPKKLKARHYIYELVKDTNVDKKPDIDVILTSFVKGLGNAGDRVSVNPLRAYESLLLPGLAVYATPENMERLQFTEDKSEEFVRYSSPYVPKMLETLEKYNLAVVMNKDEPWEIKPWHIRTSFRKSGIVVPEYAIKLPEKPIKGPDMMIEGKIFLVNVTINKTENVDVKCYVRHWSTDIKDRLPYEEEYWTKPRDVLALG